MKKKVCSFIGVVTFFLLIGTAGGYEQDLITWTRFLIQFCILIIILLLCGWIGGGDRQFK